MNKYNVERINQGKRCQERTPYETFIKGVKLYKEMAYEESRVLEGINENPVKDEQSLLETSQ